MRFSRPTAIAASPSSETRNTNSDKRALEDPTADDESETARESLTPASATSSKSPKGDIVEGEESKQLETIDSIPGFGSSSSASKRVGGEEGFVMSTKEATEGAAAPDVSTQKSLASSPPRPRSSRRSRRSNSDEIPRMVQGHMENNIDNAPHSYQQQHHQHYQAFYQQHPGAYPPPPPPPAYDPSRSSSSWGASSPKLYVQPPPPPPPHLGNSPMQLPSHSGPRTWSDNHQFNRQQPSPPPPHFAASGMSSSTSVLPDHPYEGQPLLHHSTRSSRHRRRERQHRRAYSSSAAEPDAYGSFWREPVRTDVTSSRRSNKAHFSPRNEIMGLTNSLRSTQSAGGGVIIPPDSPSSAASSTRKYYPSPRSVSGPTTPLGGGEAVFMANRHSSGRHHRTESTRKMHIRQQSAQMWVQDIKGQEQAPACRNVLFLLLFVFHLLFIGYLGNIYGNEALRPHGGFATAVTPEELLVNTTTVTDTGDHDTQEVTIYYSNLIVLAGWSGLFAVILSALLFSAMAIFSRHFVQVALCLVICLSFIWGTAGIGLSPQSFVPVTGIIALALTVAYSFIVWDRIPFAASNLLTALRGVNAVPGIIVVAFLFQAVAWTWLLYYVVVVCGVYDSIKNGDLPVSQEFRVIVYSFLGLSFYWTFQVLQVRF